MSNPIFIPLAFAANGLKNIIQKVRQTGQPAQEMTWSDGSPLITLTPLENGGEPPLGQDFNGVLNALSEHTIFNQNGGRYKWQQGVIDNFGGYPKDHIIQSDDGLTEWISLVDSNTVNPNTGIGQAWQVYAGNGSIPIASSTIAGVTKVLNSLSSTDIGSALSAAQGNVLSQRTQQATTTNVGITRFANATEVTNKSSANVAINPRNVVDMHTGSRADNGWEMLPSGLIMQWGQVNVLEDQLTSIVFPKVFPTKSFSIVLTPEYTGAIIQTVVVGAYFVGLTRTGVQVGVSSNWDFNSTARWFAIGY